MVSPAAMALARKAGPDPCDTMDISDGDERVEEGPFIVDNVRGKSCPSTLSPWATDPSFMGLGYPGLTILW
jgi:hypothetical protein